MTTPHDRFEPGDGWRRATAGEAKPSGSLRYSDGDPTHEPEWWVREAPAPPLPDVPYTVIRIHAPGAVDGMVCVLREDHAWWDLRGVAERNLKRITGFEVLAEPRRTTAQAVLDRALEEHARDENGWHDRVAREFGVSS